MAKKTSPPPTDRLGRALERLAAEDRAPAERRRHVAAAPRSAAIIEHCETLVSRVAPEYQFELRLPFELQRLLDLPLTVPAGQPPPPVVEVACVRVLAGRLSIVADLRYTQTWAFQRLHLADISASISLAPREKLTLSIRKTQRTQLTETTLRSSDSLDESESTIVDKDVLNVQRSTAHTQQWRVDGSASLSLFGGALTLGASGGIAGSVQSTSNSVVEQISEATSRTVRRLQALQKVEVARQTEISSEETQTRIIENPYRDRALTLNVYELVKQFNVSTRLAEIRPVIVLEVTDLDFDRDFVLAQGAFLDEALLDRTLVAELRETLQTVRSPVSLDARALARRYARAAFHFLFERTNVFNLDGGNPDENDPWRAFAADDAFDDAISNEAGRIFAALGTYLRLQAEIYSRPPFGPPPLAPLPPPWPGPLGVGHDLEVDFAVALAESIRAEWTALAPDTIENLLDIGDMAEPLRRVPGFLSLVDGLLKPLLKPIEEERAGAEARSRAEDVIDRVLRHLQCNKAFYVQRFLDSAWRQTHGYALADTFARVVGSGLVPGLAPADVEAFLAFFNPRLGFLDGFQFVVPIRFTPSLNAGLSFIEDVTDRPSPPLAQFETDTRDLTVPTDGFHIEPIGGRCILQELPEEGSSVTANISVEAHEG